MANINTSEDAVAETAGHADNLVETPRNNSIFQPDQPGVSHTTNAPLLPGQRKSLALITELAKRIKPFLQAGFSGSGLVKNGRPIIRAVSYNVRHAVREQDSELFIDFSKLRVSEGKLPGIHKPRLELSGRSTLTVHWADNSGPKGARPGNRFMCLVWCTDLQEPVEVIDGAPRDRKQHTLKLPRKFTGHTIHVYGAFRRTGRRITSNSLYLGAVHPGDWKR